MPPPPTSQVQRLSAVGGKVQQHQQQQQHLNHSVGGFGREETWAAEQDKRPATSGGLGREKEVERGFAGTAASLDFGKTGGGSMLLTLPSNIQNSLKMFEELQSQKNQLLTSSAKITSRSPQTTPPISTSRSASTGARGTKKHQTHSHDKENERKLQIAESVMKKLHKKNQRLTRELADLKEEHTAPAQHTHTTATPTPTPSSLQKDAKIQSLEAKIRLLEGQLKYTGKQSSPALSSYTSAQLKRLEDKHGQLQVLYNDLLDNKIDMLTGSTATVKINKEVKTFFVALRKKVHSDLIEHEVERQVWNTGMSELEDQLCERYASKRMEADAAG